MKRVSGVAEEIASQLIEWGIESAESSVSRLASFAHFLATYTEANVIGTRDLEEIVREHILDSLGGLLFEPLRDSRKLIDVGSGGGLPGIALSLVLDEARVTLLEATTKKTRFIEGAIRELGSANVRVSNARAEEAGRFAGEREVYDIATARALAALDVVAEYSLPFVAVGGHLVAMKGRLDSAELKSGEKAAEILGAEISEIIQVPRLAYYEQKQRHLIIIVKTAPTPEKYPRRTGVPAKKPLGSHRND